MKTTDSVMREFDEICFYEDELSMFETPNWTPDTHIKVKRLNAEHLGDVTGKLLPKIRELISHSLAEAKKEWVEEMRGLKKPDNDCRHSPEDSCDSNCTYQNEHKIYNQAIEDSIDLLTGDNPEEAK